MRLLAALGVNPDRARTIRQFLQFGTVGFCGFGVDVLIVYLTRHAIGLLAAGLLAYLGAVTINWLLNRIWTFRLSRSDGLLREWAAYFAANLVGFVLNRGTYLALIATIPLCREQPALAIAAGVAAGMLANFNLSRQLVFR